MLSKLTKSHILQACTESSLLLMTKIILLTRIQRPTHSGTNQTKALLKSKQLKRELTMFKMMTTQPQFKDTGLMLNRSGEEKMLTPSGSLNSLELRKHGV